MKQVASLAGVSTMDAMALLAGPERIESGWWDGADMARDYFVARAANEALLWIYRERSPAGAWYLSILGVLPAAQGRGIGAQMLAPALAAADRAGAVCYLESFSERNPAFYGRLGFDAVATHLEPTTAAPYRIMLRRPR